MRVLSINDQICEYVRIILIMIMHMHDMRVIDIIDMIQVYNWCKGY